jgi:predicted metalloprotease with PDZ domain
VGEEEGQLVQALMRRVEVLPEDREDATRPGEAPEDIVVFTDMGFDQARRGCKTGWSTIVEDMKRHQHSGPVWIGLIFHNESSSPEVLEVKSDSPAAGAGLQKGDVITAMNGTEIESLGDLIESIHHLAAGEPSKVRVLRGLEEKEVEMTPQFAGTVPESR